MKEMKECSREVMEKEPLLSLEENPEWRSKRPRSSLRSAAELGSRVIAPTLITVALLSTVLLLLSPTHVTLTQNSPTISPVPADAPFSVPGTLIEAAINCPNGLNATRADGGVVLLVHGTGSNGRESWERSPYVEFLPKAGKGFDVCWIDLPGRSLGDAQLTAEYVAWGVKYLSTKSSTGKVSIVGHSQGAGLNPQWALTFWPSIRSLVASYVALAADFHGTSESYLLCSPLLVGTCEPSIWQQTIGSHYLNAQNSLVAPGGGGTSLVPTTSIYTRGDDIIQPETPPLGPTSYLDGAVVLALQDFEVCGPSHATTHFGIIFDPAAFGLARLALENEKTGVADVKEFDRLYCTYLKENTAFDRITLGNSLGAIVAINLASVLEPKVTKEPPLQPYVCDRGFASSCGKAF